MNYQTNGCGACEGFWKFFKPPHHNFFEKECNRHDEFYNIGGDFLDRFFADWILLKDMIDRVLQYFKGRKFISKVWFLIICIFYFIALRFLGWLNFKYKK